MQWGIETCSVPFPSVRVSGEILGLCVDIPLSLWNGG